MRTVKCQCVTCGKHFVYHSNTSVGALPKTCSEECRKERVKIYTKPREKIGPHKVTTKCLVCGKTFHYEKTVGRMRKTCSLECNIVYTRSKNRKRSTLYRRKLYHGACVVCGNQFSAFVKSTITCGRSCGKRLSDKTRSINADNKRFERTGRRDDSDLVHRREKAEWKRRGDNVDRTKLFERDGWRCYICGDETPREMMGSHHPRAPEVDHIIPFAAGGQHTWVNTACACRSCNSAKKDSLTDTAMKLMELGLF